MPPAPGRLVDVGGFRLHVATEGTRGPAVVFDAALGGSSISWTFVQPSVSRFARTAAYDRAGFGWSDAGPLPRTAGRSADELHTALRVAGVPPPYVLVGHSYGGLVMRIFAARYRRDVAGVVLVDPAHPEDWADPAPKEQARIDKGVLLCRYGVAAARFRLSHLVAILVGLGAMRPARALADTLARGGLGGEIDYILSPFWKLPAEVRRPLHRFWARRRFFEALGSQIGSIATSAREALEASASGYGDLPLITLSAADPSPYRVNQQDALARLSSQGAHLIAKRSGHWIPLDEPEWIVAVIRDLVDTVRKERSPSPAAMSIPPVASGV
ncbi:MAG: alpha/beta hydrolase [Acidobacteria bacterium]|nr:alpha/beta hydrolase [Acidobacteriota bacterium]